MLGIFPAQEEILFAARELTGLAASCTGPGGRSKFLQVGTEPRNVLVTSSGARLFGESHSLALRSTPGRLLADLVKSQSKSSGDGSLFVANFACRLLVAALDPCVDNAGRKARARLHTIREGFALALSWSLEYLCDPTCLVRTPAAPPGTALEKIVMIALAKGMLSSKPVCRLRPEQCEYLAELAVYAFRRSRGQGRDDLVISNVRVLPLLGSACQESEFVDNALLLENSLYLHLPLPPPSRPNPPPPHSPDPPPTSSILHRRRPATDNPPPPTTQGIPPDSRSRLDHGFSAGYKPTGYCSSHHSLSTAEWNRCAVGEREDERRKGEGSEACAPATTVGSVIGQGERRRVWRALAGPVSVALFECSLQMEMRDPFGADVQSGLHSVFVSCLSNDAAGGNDSTWTAGARELEELETFSRELIQTGVGIVASQRLIHPWLKRRLAEEGVLPMERLSALNIAAFQAVTGARLIGSWLGPETTARSNLGAVGIVTVRYLQGRRFLNVASAGEAALAFLGSSIDTAAVQERTNAVSTLVLCAPDRPALDELQVTMDGIMRVLQQNTRDGGTALMGAGCWEVHLASYLRERVADLQRPLSRKPRNPVTSPKPKPLSPDRRPTLLPLPLVGGRRVSRAGRRRFDSPPPVSRPLDTTLLLSSQSEEPAKSISSPPPRMAMEQVGTAGEFCDKGLGRYLSSGSHTQDAWGVVKGETAGFENSENSDHPCQRGRSGSHHDGVSYRRRISGSAMQGEQQSVNGDWVEQSDVRQGRPYVLITAAAEQVCLGSAVEIFATCLETTVCRRGDAAAFSPMVDGRDSRDGDRSEGSSDSRAAGRLLPVEVLQAVRLANNIEEGTENIPKCWAVGRNVVGDTTKRVDTLGDMCDIRSICDHWEVRRGTPKSGDTRKWRSSMFTSRTNFDEKDKIRRQESCQFKIPRRLWGFDGDGQSVKEVAAFGKRDSEEGFSASVLDGLSSRVHGLESAMEACMCLMMVEGAVYAD